MRPRDLARTRRPCSRHPGHRRRHPRARRSPYDAASRGLSVALVEAGDFGCGTSFNHQKTVHGGLRALQKPRIGRAREAIRERRALARLRLVSFARCRSSSARTAPSLANRLAIRAAFQIDKWLGRRPQRRRRARAAPARPRDSCRGRDAAALPGRPRRRR